MNLSPSSVEAQTINAGANPAVTWSKNNRPDPEAAARLGSFASGGIVRGTGESRCGDVTGANVPIGTSQPPHEVPTRTAQRPSQESQRETTSFYWKTVKLRNL